MLNQRTEVRFALLEGEFRLFAISNVQGCPQHAKRLTTAVTHHLAAAMNRPYFAIGAHDSAFHVVWYGPGQRVIDRRQDPVMVVRKYHRHETVEGHLL